MPSPDLPFGFLLADVQRLYRRRFEREAEAAGLGLTSGEARTLAHVSVYDGLRQTALAEKMSIDPMTLVAFLDALEAKGLVAREPDPSDRRAKRVRLTPAAAPTVAAIRAIGQSVRDVATRGMSADEVAALRRAVALVITNLCEAEATSS